MQLSSGEDDMLARFLDESLDARVCLIEKAETLDELREFRWVFRLKRDTNNGRGLMWGMAQSSSAR